MWGGGVKEPSAAYSVAPLYDANVRLELYDDYLLSIKQSCLDNDCSCEVHTNTNTNTNTNSVQDFNKEVKRINTFLGATFKIRTD